MKIKDLPKIDRPREKLEKYGTEKLLDKELMAIILGSGGRGVNVLELAANVLRKYSGRGLGDTNIPGL